jgi:5'-3' exonuclease
MCFFVGNDFLPSLSVLDIAEASIDKIFDIYKTEVLPITKDYLTEDGVIYWEKAGVLIDRFSEHELSVLHQRMENIMDLSRKT